MFNRQQIDAAVVIVILHEKEAHCNLFYVVFSTITKPNKNCLGWLILFVGVHCWSTVLLHLNARYNRESIVQLHKLIDSKQIYMINQVGRRWNPRGFARRTISMPRGYKNHGRLSDTHAFHGGFQARSNEFGTQLEGKGQLP